MSCSMRIDGEIDRRTDITKLIVAFRNFANAPKMIINLFLIYYFV